MFSSIDVILLFFFYVNRIRATGMCVASRLVEERRLSKHMSNNMRMLVTFLCFSPTIHGSEGQSDTSRCCVSACKYPKFV